MAKPLNRPKKTGKGKKNRKYNRNRDKCKKYRERGVREKNKARKLAKMRARYKRNRERRSLDSKKSV